MDAIITARIPTEVKEQGGKILKSIGATPTQLVNAAYGYLLEKQELPQSGNQPSLKPGKRRLTKLQRKNLEESLDKMALGEINLTESEGFKSALNAARNERYENID